MSDDNTHAVLKAAQQQLSSLAGTQSRLSSLVDALSSVAEALRAKSDGSDEVQQTLNDTVVQIRDLSGQLTRSDTAGELNSLYDLANQIAKHFDDKLGRFEFWGRVALGMLAGQSLAIIVLGWMVVHFRG